MNATTRPLYLWRSLLRAEAQRLRDDAFLLLLLGLMPVVALVLHQLWPVLTDRWPDWPWSALAPFVSALLSLLTPLMMGLVLGFQCLAEREAGILAAIRLTPAGLTRTLLVRLSGYAVAAGLLTPLVHQWLGLVPLGWPQALAIGVLALPLLPFATLLVLAFARSQVEGFAIMKATGGLVSIPLLLLALMPAPSYWFAAPLPTWWTLLGYVRLAEGHSIGWLWLLVGAVCLPAVTAVFWVRLSRRSD